MDVRLAFLAQGKIHVREDDRAPIAIDSQFGQAVRERHSQIERRHDWKRQGRGGRFMAGGLLWGGEGEDGDDMHIAVTSVAQGAQPAELLYALEAGSVGGLFRVATSGADERRLFHSESRRVYDLAVNRDSADIACVIRKPGQVSSIAVMKGDASDLLEVTEGDSIDGAPAWVPGDGRKLVFQSAGIARAADGSPLGLGPATIQQIDVDGGELRTLVEESGHDFLKPRMRADGTLYYIRRPHIGPRLGATPLAVLVDFLLFPFRVAHAVFQWLNFFTTRYTGKPLTTAGGPRKSGADIRQMMEWGNLLQARHGARGPDVSEASLIAKTWQLIERSAHGATRVIATGVLAYDLGPDGTIAYTNGRALFQLGADGKSTKLLEHADIEHVVYLQG